MATRTDDDQRHGDLREEEAPPPPAPADERTVANTTVIEHDEPTARPGRMALDAVRFLVAGALMAVIGMFAAANDQSVEIDYLVDSQTVALVWPLTGMAVAGAMLMLLLRRRR